MARVLFKNGTHGLAGGDLFQTIRTQHFPSDAVHKRALHRAHPFFLRTIAIDTSTGTWNFRNFHLIPFRLPGNYFSTCLQQLGGGFSPYLCQPLVAKFMPNNLDSVIANEVPQQTSALPCSPRVFICFLEPLQLCTKRLVINRIDKASFNNSTNTIQILVRVDYRKRHRNFADYFCCIHIFSAKFLICCQTLIYHH